MTIISNTGARSRRRDSSFSQRELVIAVGLVFVITLLMTAAVLSYRALNATQQSQRRVEHTYQVLQSLEKTLLGLVNAETARRGYALVQSEELLESYSGSITQAEQGLAALKSLTANNPAQQERLAVLEPRVRQSIALLQQSIAATRQTPRDATLERDLIMRGEQVMKEIRPLIATFEEEERRLLALRQQEERQHGRHTGLTILISTCALLLLLLLLGAAIVREVARAAPAAPALREDVSSKRAVGYGIALLGTALAAAVRWGLGTLVGPELPPYITFYPIVMFSALLGGAWAGVLATALSAVAVSLLFLPPGAVQPVHLVGLALFCGINVAVSIVCGALRRARDHVVAEAEHAARAEKDLRQAEERLRVALEAAGQGVWRWDPVPRALYLSERGLALFGAAPRQPLSGEEVCARLHPEDRPKVIEVFDRCLREHCDFDLEYRVAWPDGTVHWLHGKGRPQYRASGQATSVEGVVLDITGRKQAEAAVLESRERLAALITSAMDAIITVDARQCVVMFNPAAERTFGCPAAEALGSSLERFIPTRFREVHRTHIAQFAQTGVTTRRMGGAGPALRGLRSDGTEFPIEASISQVEVAGQKLFTAILRDITERLRAEEHLRHNEQRLRAIFDHAGVGIVEMDTDDRFVAVNDRLCQILGYPHAELLGKTVHELTAPEDRPHSDLLNRQLHEGRCEGIDYEKRYLHHRGWPVWVHVTISAIRDAQGRWLRSIGTVEDITERKRTEERLAELQRSLEQANQNLEQTVAERTADLQETIGQLETFSYSIVHDLRGPLRSMNSFSHILREEYAAKLEPAALEYLQRVIDSAARMDHLITDVLSYSRVARDHMPVEAVDLLRLTQDVIDQYPNIAALKEHIVIEPVCASVRVKANLAGLTQTLSNLITNALKFVPPGRAPEVRVRCESRSQHVRLSVTDNGIGIPNEYHDKIFGIFQRLHTGEYPGTGIGLAIVKKAIERMNGRLGFESEVGKGSTFWIELPKAS